MIALVLAAVLAQPPLTPDEIFVRAQRAWQARVVPPYESFTLPCADTFVAGECEGDTDLAQFVVRASDGRSFAQSLPQGGGPSAVLMRGGYIFGPGGAPLGFYRRVGDASSPAPPNFAPDPLGPKIIATVVAVARSYDVTLAGLETVDGASCYHLVLRPIVDPDLYPLRDLWVDRSSFEVRRLAYDWDFGDGHRGIIHYEFAPNGPQHVWAIVHIDAEVSAVHELFHDRVNTVSDDLQNVGFPTSWPDADFVAPQ